MGARPRVGIAKLTSCDGCQLTLLDLEDELLALADRIDIVEFPEASSARSDGPYDLLLVEGSVGTAEQAEQIPRLREQAHTLVTIGACAQSGGVQALRNWMELAEVRASVYPRPELLDSLAQSTPVADHVHVDLELPGCPISRADLREVLVATLVGRRPQLPDEAVCLECKRRGTVCLPVSAGIPCLGPVTRTGCGALCPAVGRGCFGCFGPRERANVAGLEAHASLETEPASGGLPVTRPLRPLPLFTAWSPVWRDSLTGVLTRAAAGGQRATAIVGAPPASIPSTTGGPHARH